MRSPLCREGGVKASRQLGRGGVQAIRKQGFYKRKSQQTEKSAWRIAE